MGGGKKSVYVHPGEEVQLEVSAFAPDNAPLLDTVEWSFGEQKTAMTRWKN